jgi:chromosome segregation ATPase
MNKKRGYGWENWSFTLKDAGGSLPSALKVELPSGLKHRYNAASWKSINTWHDAVGGKHAEHHGGGGTIKIDKSQFVQSKGRDSVPKERGFDYIQGGREERWRFPPRLVQANWTVAFVTRYHPHGGHNARILQGVHHNTIMGHHGHDAGIHGVSYQNNWIGGQRPGQSGLGRTDGKADHQNHRQWVIQIVQNGEFWARSGLHGWRHLRDHGRVNQHHINNEQLAINAGRQGSENSDWNMADLMFWDRRLNGAEIEQLKKYLETYLKGGPADGGGDEATEAAQELAEIKQQLDIATNKRVEAEVEMKKAQKQKDDINREKAELEHQKREVAAALEAIRAEKSRVTQTLTQEKARIEAEIRQATGDKQAKLREIEASILAAQRTLSDRKSELTGLQRQIQDADRKRTEANNLRAQAEEAIRAAQSAGAEEKERLDREAAAAKKRADDAQLEAQRAEQRKQQAETTLRLAETKRAETERLQKEVEAATERLKSASSSERAKLERELNEAKEKTKRAKKEQEDAEHTASSTKAMAEKLKQNTQDLEAQIARLKAAVQNNQDINEKELEKLTRAEQKRMEAESATSKLEAAQLELKASQEAMKKASDSERAELALKVKEAQDKLDAAKKIEADAKAAAAKAQEEAPKDVDESVKTLATLQAELAMQKDANVEISKTETDEDDNTLYYIGGAVAGVIGLMMMT